MCKSLAEKLAFSRSVFTMTQSQCVNHFLPKRLRVHDALPIMASARLSVSHALCCFVVILISDIPNGCQSRMGSIQGGGISFVASPSVQRQSYPSPQTISDSGPFDFRMLIKHSQLKKKGKAVNTISKREVKSDEVTKAPVISETTTSNLKLTTKSGIKPIDVSSIEVKPIEVGKSKNETAKAVKKEKKVKKVTTVKPKTVGTTPKSVKTTISLTTIKPTSPASIVATTKMEEVTTKILMTTPKETLTTLSEDEQALQDYLEAKRKKEEAQGWLQETIAKRDQTMERLKNLQVEMDNLSEEQDDVNREELEKRELEEARLLCSENEKLALARNKWRAALKKYRELEESDRKRLIEKSPELVAQLNQRVTEVPPSGTDPDLGFYPTTTPLVDLDEIVDFKDNGVDEDLDPDEISYVKENM